jgi:hypothetical protein
MKSQDEELKKLRMIVGAWEATERKWAETLFHSNNNRRIWVVN